MTNLDKLVALSDIEDRLSAWETDFVADLLGRLDSESDDSLPEGTQDKLDEIYEKYERYL